MSPLNLDNADEIIYSSQQPTGTGFILGFIAVLGLVFLYLVGLFYDGVEALSHRPPIRVVGIALGVASSCFVIIQVGPAHGSHWLLACTVSPALGLCSLGLWLRHHKGQIRRARGTPSTLQVESERVSHDLGTIVNRNAGQLKHWWRSV